MNGDRRNRIQQLISEKQEISILEISQKFNISVATARRDLDALASRGKVLRIHGGAQQMRKAPPEMPILNRGNEQVNEKRSIAQSAVALIQDGETVFLGSGTTVMEVARQLTERRNLTIITNSLLVANVLANRQDIYLIILGGTFRHSENSMYGHLVELALKEVNADKVIFGIRAISLENGLTNDFMPEVPTDRQILRVGREVIIVADHTKFNRVSTALVCPLSWAHKIVTDDQTPAEVVKALRSEGIDVIVA